jgi:hypothetical protein
MSKKFYECDCATNDHVIQVWTDVELGEVMISTQLAPLLPWYKRVWVATKYVFNPHGNYSHWHDTVLNPNSTRKLVSQLASFLFATGEYGIYNNLPTFKETENE